MTVDLAATKEVVTDAMTVEEIVVITSDVMTVDLAVMTVEATAATIISDPAATMIKKNCLTKLKLLIK